MNCSTCNVPGAKWELPGGKCAKCWQIAFVFERDARTSAVQNMVEEKRRADINGEQWDAWQAASIKADRQLYHAIKAARRWKARYEQCSKQFPEWGVK